MDAGTLAYMVGDTYLGVAFEGVPRGQTLYPIIQFRGKGEVKIRYINSIEAGVPSLKEMSRFVIRKAARNATHNNSRGRKKKLPTPKGGSSCIATNHSYNLRKRKLPEEKRANRNSCSESNMDLELPDALKHYLLS